MTDTAGGSTARVVIVDDHDEFRAVARALLQRCGYDVIGEASDGAGAVDRTHALQPDVLLLDIQLPDEDGIAVAGRVAALPTGRASSSCQAAPLPTTGAAWTCPA